LKNTYNILVTGCGGDIGQSIGKILKSELLFSKVIGADMNSDHPGKFIFDACHQVPRCDDNFYFETLKSIVDKERIDIILPIAEPELRYFTEQQIDEVLLGKPLIVANIKAREIGFDKLLTAKFLENSGLPFPQTHILSDMRTPDFPQLVKDRNGSGSKALFFLNDKIDFEYYKTKHPGFIVQELIGTPEAEYTCGVFRSNKDEIRTLIYKRKLTGGSPGME
jgi:carbamoyl-phosphate synthase large subunit